MAEMDHKGLNIQLRHRDDEIVGRKGEVNAKEIQVTEETISFQHSHLKMMEIYSYLIQY